MELLFLPAWYAGLALAFALFSPRLYVDESSVTGLTPGMLVQSWPFHQLFKCKIALNTPHVECSGGTRLVSAVKPSDAKLAFHMTVPEDVTGIMWVKGEFRNGERLAVTCWELQH